MVFLLLELFWSSYMPKGHFSVLQAMLPLPLKPRFDNFEQASVYHFCLAVSLRVSWRRVVILDSYVLENFLKLGVVKLSSIV